MPVALDRQRLEARVGDELVRWVEFVTRRRRVVLIGCALLFAASLGTTVRGLGIQADKNALFPDDIRFKVLEARYLAAFPQMTENIVIVLEGPTAEATRTAAHRLAAALEADPEHFEHVYLPAHPFFETHGLLFLDREELEDIADRLARLQPMWASVVRDPTIPGLVTPLLRALEAVREGSIDGFDLAPVLDRIAAVLASLDQEDAASLDWSEIVTWGDTPRNLLRQIIYVTPKLDFGSMAVASESIEALDAIRRELAIGVAGGAIRVRTTGDMVLNFEEMNLLKTQVRAAGLASFAAVALLLFVALRSGRLVVATIASLLFGLVCTAGFATVAIGHLNMISVAFAVLFIGLGVDFGIHLCMRFQELVRAGRDARSALVETVRGVGSSLLLCAVTTSIGFFAFVPTDFVGVAELGVIAGVGMYIALAASFTILAALLTGAPPTAKGGGERRRASSTPGWPARYPRVVAMIALVLGGAAVVAIPEIRFDQSPFGVRDPAAESVIVYEELLAEPGASPWSVSYLARSREEAVEMKVRFEALPEVEVARTLMDFVADDQPTKLAIVEEMALFADWTSIERISTKPSMADRSSALQSLRAELERDPSTHVGPEVARASSELLERLRWLEADLDGLTTSAADARLRELEARLLDRFEDPLDRLERALEADVFDEADLPDVLRDRFISASGLFRVEVVPTMDLADAAALDHFVESVRRVSEEVAGPPVSIHDSARSVVGALQQAFLAAFCVILGILVLLWRRVGDVLLVVLPLVWAGMMTGLVMVLVDIDFNFADVIVLPLLLGIGVDSGIHMVHRARIDNAEGASLLETSTARAVVFSAFTTIASFGSLALVPHLGMASLGQLLVIGVFWTVVANLILLPALLVLQKRRPA